VPRLLIVALLASAAITGTAHAQYGGGERPMPGYDDGERPDPRGYDDRYGTDDARAEEESPIDEQRMADYREAKHWSEPRPYARADQVDEGTPNDAAHRADRAYTAELNRSANARSRPTSMGGSNAQYRADMQAYRAARARYADHLDDWHRRVAACEAGYYDACQ
jgi:hypothetical protein